MTALAEQNAGPFHVSIEGQWRVYDKDNNFLGGICAETAEEAVAKWNFDGVAHHAAAVSHDWLQGFEDGMAVPK
jgi:hypothetical protein